MNFLYITDNDTTIRDKAERHALYSKMEFFSFCNNKDGIKNITYLYNNMDNIVIFLNGLNKSNVSDALLKVLEDNKKNIIMYATTDTYDVKEPLKARFTVLYYDNKDIEQEVQEFIKTKKAKKEVYSSLSFYIALANNTVDYHKLSVINNIIKEIKKCTYNIPWDYYFMLLKEEF